LANLEYITKVVDKLNNALEYIEDQRVHPWKEVRHSYNKMLGLHMKIYEEIIIKVDKSEK
jgi:hypothetical protein